MVRSWKVALPAPAPPPPPMLAPLVSPQENDSTSISSLCLESRDSPLMSPIFAKMSAAIWYIPTIVVARPWALTQPRVEAAISRVSTLEPGSEPGRPCCARGGSNRLPSPAGAGLFSVDMDLTFRRMVRGDRGDTSRRQVCDG